MKSRQPLAKQELEHGRGTAIHVQNVGPARQRIEGEGRNLCTVLPQHVWSPLVDLGEVRRLELAPRSRRVVAKALQEIVKGRKNTFA